MDLFGLVVSFPVKEFETQALGRTLILRSPFTDSALHLALNLLAAKWHSYLYSKISFLAELHCHIIRFAMHFTSSALVFSCTRIAVAPGLGWCTHGVSWVIQMPFLSRLSTDSVRWFDICRCLVVVPIAWDGIRRDFTADFDDSATRIKKNWKVPFRDWS